MNDVSPVLLAARDESLIEAVEASALALGVGMRLARDSEELWAGWQHAPLRLVAPEMAARVSLLAPLPSTFLVGSQATPLAEASAELGFAVVLLPSGSSRLADLLVQASRPSETRATTVAVARASGGLGSSTLTLGLGMAAAAQGRASVIVELAEAGGGLDLLAGAETSDGLRWPDLQHARGELGDVRDALVDVGGAGLLALSRQTPGRPEPATRRAVLGSLARSSELLLVDAGSEALPGADATLLVVGADVRCVASARMWSAEQGGAPTGLVVRTGQGRRLPPGAVAEALGAPLIGELREDKALPRLAHLGQPALAAPARKFRRDVGRILARLGDA